MAIGLSYIKRNKFKYDSITKAEKESELFFSNCSGSLNHIINLFKTNNLTPIRFIICVLVFIPYYLFEVLFYLIEGIISIPFKTTHNRHLLYTKDSIDYKQYTNLWKPKKRKLTNTNIITNINLEKRKKGNTVLPTTDYFNEERENYSNAVNVIRKVLFKTNFVLNGVVVNTKFRKIPDDELLQYSATEELSSPYLTQEVSFGDEINNSLKVLLKGKVKFTTKRKVKKTYLIVEDGNLNDIETEIGKLVGKDKIQIKLVQD